MEARDRPDLRRGEVSDLAALWIWGSVVDAVG